MRTLILLPIPIFLMAVAVPAAASSPSEEIAGTVHGYVLDADGKPLPAAHAHLTNMAGDLRWTIATAAADESGRFEVLVASPGVYRVTFTGVGHETASVPIVLEKERQAIELTIRLAPTLYPKEERSPRIVGSWDGFNTSRAPLMAHTPDGAYVHQTEVDQDTVLYKIIDMNGVQSALDGTDADFYVHDGGGNYLAAKVVHPGPLSIRFDPSGYATEPDPSLPATRFAKENTDLAVIEGIDLQFAQAQESFIKAYNQYKLKHDSMDGFDFDWSAPVGGLCDEMHDSRYASVRAFAAVKLMKLVAYGAEVDSADVALAAGLLPAESPMWGWEPALIVNITRASDFHPGGRDAFLAALAERNPQLEIRGYATAQLAMNAQRAGDKGALERYRTELEGTYAQVPGMDRYIEALTPGRIEPGNPVPDFEVALLGEPGTLSNESLRGRYYLLDFWATWCAPCRAELGGLTEAYEKFGGEDLVFLSISFDKNVETVDKFREKWKMPWRHAFLKDGFRSPMAKTFEVKSIPKPVLVGPDGIIVATGRDLRGPALERTLSALLKKN